MSGDRKFWRRVANTNWAGWSDEDRQGFEDAFFALCIKGAAKCIKGAAEPKHSRSKQQMIYAVSNAAEIIRDAIITLLENGYLPSKGLLKGIADDLYLAYRADRQERRRSRSLVRAQFERLDLEQTIAAKRSEGLSEKVAVAQARKEVASRWGRNSAGALRKALQPSRMNRRRRSTMGPKQRKKCPAR